MNQAVSTGTHASPYVGPRPFSRDDIDQGRELYGRDHEVDRLTDLLVGKRIVLLHSPSGAGKTSLIQAKLLPRLADEDFQVLPIIRVGMEVDSAHAGANRYLYSMLRSLENVLGPEVEPEGQQGLPDIRRLLARVADPGGKSQLLVFDQFEEILTLDPTDAEAKSEFLTELGVALRDRNRWALFSIREDYLAALESYAWAIPTRFTTTLRLDLLGPTAAAEAIGQPAAGRGVTFEPAAIDKLVDDLRRVRVQSGDGATQERPGPYVEPVQLQVVCARLWDRLPPGARSITPDDVLAAGEVDTALSDYYAERVQHAALETGVGEHRIREWFEHQLITQQGIRGQVLRGLESSQGLSNNVVELLEDGHLIRAEKRRNATWYELAHDRLIQPIQADNFRWREAHLNLLQRQAALWVAEGRPERLLLREDAYREAHAWAAAHPDDVMPAEQELLEASESALTAERDRRRARVMGMLTVVSSIFVTVCLLLTGWALFEWSVAQTQASDANQARMVAEERKDEANAQKSEADTQRARAEEQTLDANQQRAIAEDARSRADDQEQLASAGLLASQSRLLAPEQLDLALLLAVRANQMRDIPETRGALLEDVKAAPALSGFFNDGHTNWVRGVAVSPDGEVLAAGDADGKISLSHGMPHQPILFDSGQQGVFGMAFSPDGETLASSGLDDTVRLWDAATGEPRQVGPMHHDSGSSVYSVSYSPDGQTLASAGSDGKIHLWDPSTGQEKHPPLTRGPGTTYSVQFSTDEPVRLVAAGADSTIDVWDAATYERVASLVDDQQERDGALYSAGINAAGTRVAAAGRGSAVNVWDVDSSTRLAHLTGAHDNSIFALAFNPDGTLLATAGADKRLVVWDVGRLEARPNVFGGANDKIYSMAWSTGDSLFTGLANGRIVRWSPRGALLGTALFGSLSTDVSSVAFSPKRSLTAVAAGTVVRRSDIATYVPLTSLRPETSTWINVVAFSGDGQLLAGGGADGRISLWAASGDQTSASTLPRLDTSVNTIAFGGPDGQLLASGGCIADAPSSTTCGDSNTGTLRFWDVANHRQLSRLSYSGGSILSLAFSHDGTLMASGDDDGWVVLWDVQKRQPIDQFQGDPEKVYALAFNPSGTLLAYAGQESIIHLWDTQTGTTLPETLNGHRLAVKSLTFSADGDLLVSAGLDGDIVLWDVPDRRLMGRLPREHGGEVDSVALSPDGRYLVSGGSGDVTAIRWPMSPAEWRSHACEIAGRTLTPLEWHQFVGPGDPEPLCPLVAVQQALIDVHAGKDSSQIESEFAALVAGAAGDDWSVNNVICWYGAIEGYASTVMPSCDRAVSAAPPEYKPQLQDSRGLALARQNDLADAAQEFQAFVDAYADAPELATRIARRQHWIEQLRANINPFDAATLHVLELE